VSSNLLFPNLLRKKILGEEKEKYEMELDKETEEHKNQLAQEKSFVNGLEVNLESLNQLLTTTHNCNP